MRRVNSNPCKVSTPLVRIHSRYFSRNLSPMASRKLSAIKTDCNAQTTQRRIPNSSHSAIKELLFKNFNKITNCYSNGNDRPHRRRCTDRRIVFARFRQYAPYLYSILRSTQHCIPPESLNRVPASVEVKAGMSALPSGRACELP